MRNITLWLVIVLVFIFLAKNVATRETPDKLTLVQFVDYAKQKTPDGKQSRILKAEDKGGVIKGEYLTAAGKKQPFETTYMPGMAPNIWDLVTQNQITGYTAKVGNELISQIFISVLLPILFLFVLWMLLMRQFQSGSNKALSFGKSRAKLVTEGQVKVTFEDVAGIDEVKEELTEIIQFLKDPKKFSRLGAKIPKGALLYGPPGTGKTLVARAVAGEASVPFFSISGSDFVEMFVGVGASRVRDLFEQGKKAKPCLIFIDEIDAVGRHRFAGIGGGHDEREQTLNQLLVELDGFAPNEGVIVMASTNRPDVLDPALLRPGRFDRQIRVDLPDLVGREKILAVHTRQIKMGDGIDLRQIAKGTPGFSGADLANLANEAALLAARRNRQYVAMADLEEAKDRVMMGPERRSMVLGEKERKITAFHEAGHALVAKFTPDNESRVHKVTIIPRGRSLGLTAILPDEEKHNESRQGLSNFLTYVMGGRAAEEIAFSEFSTGASNDLHRATDLAHRMVCEYGMSDRLGPRTFGQPDGQVFLGKDMTRERNYSEETAGIIDNEIHGLLSGAYDRAKDLLQRNRAVLDRVSEALMDRETLDADELDKVIAGETLPPLFRDDRGNRVRQPEAPQHTDAERPGMPPVFHPQHS